MKKICICGHFGFGKKFLDGQTVKTKVIADELEKQWGKNEIYKIDTHGRINQIVLFFKIIFALATCKNLIILPSRNSLRLLVPWIVISNFFFKRRLHYLLIGGWLYEFLKEHRVTAWALKYFYCIYPENSKLTDTLQKIGYKNVKMLPNSKNLKIVSKTFYEAKTPLPLVTFSRIMKKKGIEDAVNAVRNLNQKEDGPIYTLDIYGPIHSGEEKWFEDLESSFTREIQYKGCVDFEKSVETLRKYYLLLFPTQFPMEGIPGTIIDAYAAGLPIVSSRWNHFDDIIIEGITGFGYEMNNVDELENILKNLSKQPENVCKLRSNCTKKALEFLPENVIQTINLL